MNTETKFKLDQKVLIKHPSVLAKNLTGVINDINHSTADGSTAYRVLIDGEQIGFWYLEQYLEAVADAPVFKLGDSVVIKDEDSGNYNKVGVIDQLSDSRAGGSPTYRVKFPENGFHYWYIERLLGHGPAPAEEPAEEKVDLTQLALDNLKKMWEDLRANYAKDMETISQRLIEEAENRGWCREFDDIIDEVNDKLVGPCRLDTREQDIEIEVTVRSTVYATTTVIVRARDEDQAAQFLADEPDSYFDMNDVLSDHVSNWGFEDIDWEMTN
jgi:hypothetical protein